MSWFASCRRPGTAAALALALLGPGTALAAGEQCGDGFPRIGYLGVSLGECNCTYSFDSNSGRVSWRFREEPRIEGVRDDGPAANKLKPGDVIEAIDGVLITTAEGGRRFAALEPGRAVSLKVRREGREASIVIAPGSTCMSEVFGDLSMLVAPRALRIDAHLTPAPEAPAAPPAAAVPPTPAAPRTPRPRFPDVLAPPAPGAERSNRGWIGIGLDFQRCDDASDDGTWCFGTLPQVSFVEPQSPADRAGLERGDVLTHIDGVALNSPDGGRRFTRIAPQQTVRFTLRRGNVSKQIAVTPAARTTLRAVELRPLLDKVRELRQNRSELGEQLADLEARLVKLSVTPRAPLPDQDKRLRYAGSVGGSDVEVRGLGNVVVDDSGDEIVIVTPDATIRVKPGAKATRTERTRRAGERR